MKKIIVILVSILFFACSGTHWEEMHVAEFKDEINAEKVQLIDVRTPEEYMKGHIAYAENMDVLEFGNFITSLNKLDKEKPVYLYCHSGVRSTKAAEILLEQGFEEIVELEGGYDAWTKSQTK